MLEPQAAAEHSPRRWLAMPSVGPTPQAPRMRPASACMHARLVAGNSPDESLENPAGCAGGTGPPA